LEDERRAIEYLGVTQEGFHLLPTGIAAAEQIGEPTSHSYKAEPELGRIGEGDLAPPFSDPADRSTS